MASVNDQVTLRPIGGLYVLLVSNRPVLHNLLRRAPTRVAGVACPELLPG